MLRSFLIYLSQAAWAQNTVTNWNFAWRTASRFVAGTKLDDAIRVVSELNARNINVTLDHLGEHTNTPEEAQQSTDSILASLDVIGKSDARANVSIKLTQIGLSLDEGLCAQNLEQILARAKSVNVFIRIDMEDTPYTDKTIDMFYKMRAKGFTNVGIVLQSYLFRTEADARRLLGDKAPIRLVKGAYNEPADKAFPKKTDVDANYDLLAKIMIDAAVASGAPTLGNNGRFPPIPAFGTHDEKRIVFAKQYAEKVNLPKEAMEFQMLYGIRRDLQEQLANEGYPVRVYVPFGTHWYPYFMRRLAERPANIWFFISNFFRE
ncbi:MAG TPA: proline dehydrogenase family protein [Anaerolineales bacterium]|nr:proline dehydrogenase family protein [Anaerolineales bacterium]